MKKDTSRKIRTAAFLAVLAAVTTFVSCKNDDDEVIIITPDVPEEVLPTASQDSITKYMNIYEGDTPPELNGQFLSKPHKLIYASYDPENDSTFFYDRYVAFVFSSGHGIDFYGKQWDDSLQDAQGNYHAGYYEEHIQNLKITGTGDNFSCYYITEGYPNGMYAKQSTIFSGEWVKGEGLKDFKVAVILVETSGNPNLQPKGSFRILGDADGLAEVNNWMGKATEPASHGEGGGDTFFLFRK